MGGVSGFIPANTTVEGLVANEDTEYLGNFYGPIAFFGPDKKSVKGLLAGPDVKAAANERGLTLIPTTLAECMVPKPEQYKGPAEPLAFSRGGTAWARMSGTEADAPKAILSPHFVDTKKLPWIVNPDTPDVGLKIMRVSEETGTISLIVKHNGAAPPHYHLGASDFLVLSGNIGYQACGSLSLQVRGMIRLSVSGPRTSSTPLTSMAPSNSMKAGTHQLPSSYHGCSTRRWPTVLTILSSSANSRIVCW